MAEAPPLVPSRRVALGQALKALRLLRGRRPGEMAAALNMPRRSYEYFEAGSGPLNVDRIHQFAQVLDVDPFAILVAMEIRSPRFAVACAENKLTTLLMILLQEFDAAAGEAIGRLTAAHFVTGLATTFDALAREARAEDDFLGRWIGGDGPPSAPDAPPDDDPSDPPPGA